MLRIKRKRDRLVPIVLCLLICQVGKGSADLCMGYEVHKSAWSFGGSKASERMVSDATLKKNKGVSKREKIKRIKERIEWTHSNKAAPKESIDSSELAQTIMDIADCTGLDFTLLSGLFYVESKFCAQRVNLTKSGATGCGQFTKWPVNVFKNQLRLAGRAENGSKKAKDSMETVIRRCLKKETRIKKFKELFSKSVSQVKKVFRNGSDIELDIFASALYLKFHYARTNSYKIALKAYGEGTDAYANKVTGQAKHINYTCRDQSDYLEEIQQISCGMSNDLDACYFAKEDSIEI